MAQVVECLPGQHKKFWILGIKRSFIQWWGDVEGQEKGGEDWRGEGRKSVYILTIRN
jgi:hypothetical protein